MKNTSKKAIYLDHYKAMVFDYINQTAVLEKTIASEMNPFVKEEILQKGESHWHNKEQDLQRDFYKKIMAEIAPCNEVFFFGPTNAKTELINIIQDKPKFNTIKIYSKDIDKMTENQKIELINATFKIL
ncbi:hypothetical protein [Flavobacterium sp. TSSA_36]|uniref:hypothetical protein n=1 Tax=Flavobacterium sp. TSSA_36 TaxID=3447669 RepID=UPI003F314123